MRDIEQPAGAQSGRDPVEGRDDLDLPGADRAGPPSEHPDGPVGTSQPLRDISDQPDARDLAGLDEEDPRLRVGMPEPTGSGATGRGAKDVLPDVEVPDDQT
jgi:hypothetical protein